MGWPPFDAPSSQVRLIYDLVVNSSFLYKFTGASGTYDIEITAPFPGVE